MPQLEIEFRVYRTPEPGRKRECIVTRSVPHALQVWDESVDAYSRNLELVISGEWLMRMLERNNAERPAGGQDALDECARAKIREMCIQALTSDDAQQKQHCLEEVLVALGYDLDTLGSTV